MRAWHVGVGGWKQKRDRGAAGEGMGKCYWLYQPMRSGLIPIPSPPSCKQAWSPTGLSTVNARAVEGDPGSDDQNLREKDFGLRVEG